MLPPVSHGGSEPKVIRERWVQAWTCAVGKPEFTVGANPGDSVLPVKRLFATICNARQVCTRSLPARVSGNPCEPTQNSYC